MRGSTKTGRLARVAMVAVVVGAALTGAEPARAVGDGLEDDVYELPVAGALTVAAPGVRLNDPIPPNSVGTPGTVYAGPDGIVNVPGTPGLTFTISVLAPPAHGTVTLSNDGSFTYTPAGPPQDDSFTYSLTRACTSGDCTYAGPSGVVDTATVTLTTDDPAADAPVPGSEGDLVDDAYDLPESGPLELTAPGVRSNDTIPADSTGTPGIYIPPIGAPGDPVYVPPIAIAGTPGFTYTLSLLNAPEHGTVVFGGDGAVLYTPVGQPQDDVFSYRLTRLCTSGDCAAGGSAGTVDTATVTLTAAVPDRDPDPDPDPGTGTDPEAGGATDGSGTDGSSSDGAVAGTGVTAGGGLPVTGGDDGWLLVGLCLAAVGFTLRRLRARVEAPPAG